MSPDPLFELPPPVVSGPRPSLQPLRVVYVVAVVSGLIILAGSVGPTAARTPALAAVSTLLFMMFAVVCAWLLNRIPYFWPVGRDAKTLAVLWGALAAVGYALPANQAIYQHFSGRDEAQGWALFAPFTEEPIKDLGIVVVLLLAANRPRTALDGLVVGSFVGLGFEVVENVVQSINNAIASSPVGHPGQWASLVTDVIHEVVRRSWTGHIVITGIAGFGIAYAMTITARSAARRWAVGSALVLLAFAGHLLWNSHRFGVLYVVGQFSVLAVYLWLIRVGRGQESRLYRPYLSYSAPSLALGDDRTTARLAAAIAYGDAGTALRCAQRLTG